MFIRLAVGPPLSKSLHDAQLGNLLRCFKLDVGQLQDVRFDALRKRPQRIDTARPIALCRGTGLVPHDLRNCTGRSACGFPQQRKGATQAVKCQMTNSRTA